MGRVAELACVTVRTLHHYDEIGLVRPSARSAAGYRVYSAGDVERLREVLAYRRLGFGLRQVADLVGDPPTDAVAHLRRLRGLLLEQRDRSDVMVAAIDRERRIWDALGDAQTVLNVGAGAGSYEPNDRDVTAVEPSAVMRAQRLREMRRVARRVVVLTFDAEDALRNHQFWLTRDYMPGFASLFTGWPSLDGLTGAIGGSAEPVRIPWDCADGLFEAYWRRPEAYLDESVRRAVSTWTRIGPAAEQRAVRGLDDDLASGRWAQRNRDLADVDAAEFGLRLLIA